jgi:hypothetical protein
MFYTLKSKTGFDGFRGGKSRTHEVALHLGSGGGIFLEFVMNDATINY